MIGGRISPDAERVLRAYWRRKWLLLALIVGIPATVYALSMTVEKRYEASTTLIVRDTGVSPALFSNQISISTANGATVVRLLETTAVARGAAEEMGISSREAGGLLAQVQAAVDAESAGTGGPEFVTITAADSDPERAAEIANAFAAAISEQRLEDAQQEIDETLAEVRQQARALDDNSPGANELAIQLQRLEGLRAAQENSTQVLEPATPPGSPISPQPRRNAGLGLILALLVAAGLAPLLDWANRRVRSDEDLEEVVPGSVLAAIPRSAFPGHAPSATVKEAFQTLRASLTYFNVGRTIETVLITSPSHQEGKTTVATNLAGSLAFDGNDVILIDGDLRRPQVASRVGAKVDLGLEQVLLEGIDPYAALEEIELGPVAGGKLRVLASPLPATNPSVLLGSDKMRELLDRLNDNCDIVVLDTPPVLAVADAIPLLSSVSGVVLVAKAEATALSSLKRAVSVIETAQGLILGSTLTGVRSKGGYGYGYGYYYPEAEENSGAQIGAGGR